MLSGSPAGRKCRLISGDCHANGRYFCEHFCRRICSCFIAAVPSISVPRSDGEQQRLVRAVLLTPQAEGGSSLRQDVFSLVDGGEVTISWPVPLTQDINYIKDWLKIVERKITRSLSDPKSTNEAAE